MTTWITDDNGNRCSVEYWGSEEAARQAQLDEIAWLRSSLVSLLALAEAENSPLTNKQVASICKIVLNKHEGIGRTETLGTALLKEMARVRNLLPLYDAIPTGVFVATMMRADLDGATKAMAKSDFARMIVHYQRLKDYKE